MLWSEAPILEKPLRQKPTLLMLTRSFKQNRPERFGRKSLAYFDASTI